MLCTEQIWCLEPTEVLEHTFGFISALSAAVIALAAWIGKNSLKMSADQQRFKREMDHAERILITTYNAKKALFGIKNTFEIMNQFSSQYPHAKSAVISDDSMDPSGTTIDGKVLIEKVNSEEKHNNALIECIPIALSISEKEVHDSLEELSEYFQSVIFVARYLTKFEKGYEGTEPIRKVFDRLFGENSGDMQKGRSCIDSIVERIESRCLKILHRNRRKRSWSLLKKSTDTENM